MPLYHNHFSTSSPFYLSQTQSSRLGNVRSNPFATHSPSTAYQRSSHFTDAFLSRLDQIDVLGGPDSHGNEIGHSGCVNALAWSQSGHCLATGSDDRKVILWKLGSSGERPTSVQNVPTDQPRSFPNLDLAQSDVIETGHSANIFNVKWAPNCSDRRLFTCAGDCQIRVFDIERAASASVDCRLESGKEYKLWQEGQGACVRVLSCHSGRAKKISTENSPDVFLTAAEDGEVRQTDLRVPHTCSRSRSYGQGCPRPLMQFQMELYSLSVSKLEPWLFAIAGTSDKVYLQDRRMIPRLLKNEWGAHVDEETAALTHCVRRFAREPKPGSGGDLNERRRRSRLERAHVTAVKISEANGRDLLASYSADGVYRFDIKSEPGRAGERESAVVPSSKRRKTSSGSVTPTSKAGQDEVSKWEQVRAQTSRVLFVHDDSRITRTFTALALDLDRLAEAVQVSPPSASWLDREQSVIALGKVLVYIKGATLGRSETVDLHLNTYKEEMLRLMEADVAVEFVSLVEELEEANKWQAYSEEVKIRILLWDRAEEYISSWWTSEQTSASTAGLGRTSIAEEIDDDDDSHASFHRRFQAIVDTTGSSSDDDGEEMVRAPIDGASGLGDTASDMDDDDDDEMLLNFTDAESSDDGESSRHGISGENAPVVYPLGCHTGHCNEETVKDCGFLGSNDEYIWSGSDCGHFFIWSNDRAARLKGIWKGDGSVVNVLAPHPTLPVCAVSGIDETVKIFGPVSPDSARLADAFPNRERIMERNSRQDRVGFRSRGLMRFFAQHMDVPQGLPRRMLVDGEEEDCTVM